MFLSVRSYHRACNQFSDYCPADLDSGNVFLVSCSLGNWHWESGLSI